MQSRSGRSPWSWPTAAARLAAGDSGGLVTAIGDMLRAVLLKARDDAVFAALPMAGPARAWLLVIENDNQGGFRIDFFGPADACRELRSHLDQSSVAEQAATAGPARDIRPEGT